MKESNILKQIELELSKHDCRPFRTNAGKFYGGKLIRGEITVEIKGYKRVKCSSIILNPTHIEGLPEGFPDCLVLAPKGETLLIETKTLTGKQREEQQMFEKMATDLGHKYIVCRSLEDIKKYL